MSTMGMEPALDRLESQVLARIGAYRQLERSRRTALPIGLAIAVCSLAAGMSVGVYHAPHAVRAIGSEAVILASDARLAPSALLTSGQ